MACSQRFMRSLVVFCSLFSLTSSAMEKCEGRLLFARRATVAGIEEKNDADIMEIYTEVSPTAGSHLGDLRRSSPPGDKPRSPAVMEEKPAKIMSRALFLLRAGLKSDNDSPTCDSPTAAGEMTPGVAPTPTPRGDRKPFAGRNRRVAATSRHVGLERTGSSSPAIRQQRGAHLQASWAGHEKTLRQLQNTLNDLGKLNDADALRTLAHVRPMVAEAYGLVLKIMHAGSEHRVETVTGFGEQFNKKMVEMIRDGQVSALPRVRNFARKVRYQAVMSWLSEPILNQLSEAISQAPDSQKVSRNNWMTYLNTFGWKKTRTLGEGQFATVLELENEKFGTKVALKVINLKTGLSEGNAFSKEDQLMQNEAAANTEFQSLKDLSNIPEVPRLYGASGDGPVYIGKRDSKEAYLALITMEHLPGQNIGLRLRHMKNSSQKMSIRGIINHFKQLLSVLSRMEVLGISNGDLKPANIVATEGGKRLRFIDWGSAGNSWDHPDSIEDVTQMYRAPEVMAPGEIYSYLKRDKADVWSGAWVMLHELAGNRSLADMFSAAMKFPVSLGEDKESTIEDWFDRFDQMVAKCKEEEANERDKELVDKFAAILKKCFTFDPDNRPSAQDVFLGAEFRHLITKAEGKQSYRQLVREFREFEVKGDSTNDDTDTSDKSENEETDSVEKADECDEKKMSHGVINVRAALPAGHRVFHRNGTVVSTNAKSVTTRRSFV